MTTTANTQLRATPALNRATHHEIPAGGRPLGGGTGEDAREALRRAFSAQDAAMFQALLDEHGLADRSADVCRRLCRDEAVRLTVDLAGAPPADQTDVADARRFAEIAAEVAADEELLEAIVAAAHERDATAWLALVDTHGLAEFSHLLAHWVAVVHYRLLTDAVCRPDADGPDLLAELRAAGRVIGRIAQDGVAFAAAVKAVEASGSAPVGPTWICVAEWFASWRRVAASIRLRRLSRLSDATARPRSLAPVAATPRVVEAEHFWTPTDACLVACA